MSVDPLDAFMAEIAAMGEGGDGEGGGTKRRGERWEEEDHVASFIEEREAAKSLATKDRERGGDYGADSAGLGGMVTRDEQRQDLPSSSAHAAASPGAHAPFLRDVYRPVGGSLSESEASDRRRELHVRVCGHNVPPPALGFGEMGLGVSLLASIKREGLVTPTPIQAQAIPVALSGRSLIGLAKTGSGKTLSYLLPSIVHVAAQIKGRRRLGKGLGPISLVLVPSRELGCQVFGVSRNYSKSHDHRVVLMLGGMNKTEQFKSLKGGTEAAIATPGRLLDLLRMKAFSLDKCTFVVLDEADRMLDMGFENQVQSILASIRPDRQTILFSATMPPKMQKFIAEAKILDDESVRIQVGESGVNEEIAQKVVVFKNQAEKGCWLRDTLQGFVDEGEVLIFASHKEQVEKLAADMAADGHKSESLHGDMHQQQRLAVTKAFKQGHVHVLVATDVAARGLDFENVKTVINFDPAKNIDIHIHRIGRTGRGDTKDGQAVTLVTPADQTKILRELEKHFIYTGQAVPHALSMELKHREKGGHQATNTGGRKMLNSANGQGGHTRRKMDVFISSTEGTQRSDTEAMVLPPKRQRSGPPPPAPRAPPAIQAAYPNQYHHVQAAAQEAANRLSAPQASTTPREAAAQLAAQFASKAKQDGLL